MKVLRKDPQRKDIVFFDVETPTMKNNSICALGLVRTDAYGAVLASCYYVIDPESYFDYQNTKVHGLTADDVAGCPDFKRLWNFQLKTLFQNANLVAHNARFDLGVLAKSLARYELPPLPDTGYACTLELSRQYMPSLSRHKLDIVSAAIGIDLDHHQALSDATACKAIFEHLETLGLDRTECWKPYDFVQLRRGVMTRDEERRRQGARIQRVKDNLPDMVERDAGAVDLDGSLVCLTGNFECSPNSKIPVMRYLEGKGATIAKSPTRKCDYLVVGNLGSPLWKMGAYGKKIEKAMGDIESGVSEIRIIDENSVIGDDFR